MKEKCRRFFCDGKLSEIKFCHFLYAVFNGRRHGYSAVKSLHILEAGSSEKNYSKSVFSRVLLKSFLILLEGGPGTGCCRFCKNSSL